MHVMNQLVVLDQLRSGDTSLAVAYSREVLLLCLLSAVQEGGGVGSC